MKTHVQRKLKKNGEDEKGISFKKINLYEKICEFLFQITYNDKQTHIPIKKNYFLLKLIATFISSWLKIKTNV